MASFTNTKPRVAVGYKQERFPSQLVQICAASIALRQIIPMRHAYITRSHIRSYGNGNIFTVIRTMNCYQNIVVF